MPETQQQSFEPLTCDPVVGFATTTGEEHKTKKGNVSWRKTKMYGQEKLQSVEGGCIQPPSLTTWRSLT